MKIFSVIAAAVFCAALAIVPVGCSSGGGGSDSGGSSSGAAPGPGAGFVIFPNDPLSDNPTGGSVSSVLQSVQLFNSNGTALSTPSLSQPVVYNGVGDIDGSALTPDGSHGVFVDGANSNMYFFTVQNGYAQPTGGMHSLSISTFGTDADSVALTKDGDEAVVSMDDSNTLLLVAGINSGNPKPAAYIYPSDYRDGVALSDDNTVLLARGSSGLDVFAINSVSESGWNGTTVTHAFYLKTDLTNMGETTYDSGGHDGIAFSPGVSDRAVVIANATNSSSSSINLVMGLPNSAFVNSTVPINDNVHSVAVSGDLAIVGTDHGIQMFSGVKEGTLSYVASMSSYNNGSTSIGRVTTLQITSNGQYVVAGDYDNGALLNIPITSTPGFGNPAGVLTGVSVPWNDEMMVH